MPGVLNNPEKVRAVTPEVNKNLLQSSLDSASVQKAVYPAWLRTNPNTTAIAMFRKYLKFTGDGVRSGRLLQYQTLMAFPTNVTG